MKELIGRNNTIIKTYRDKRVIIYEDHRSILNVLWLARKSKNLIVPPTIVCFDKHDDFRDPIATQTRLQQIINSNITKEEFWNFVEWEISTLDGDWIKTGMELKLIGDVILIGAEETPNISDTVNKYTDHNGSDHFLYSVGHLWSGFSHQGWLTDLSQRYLYEPIWDLLGWQNITGTFCFDSSKRKAPIVLDFDLDCFSTRLLENIIAWRKDIFFSSFNSSDNHGYTPKDFLLQLFLESNFTTIAKESECFSHINESAYVLGYLNELLFDNYL